VPLELTGDGMSLTEICIERAGARGLANRRPGHMTNRDLKYRPTRQRPSGRWSVCRILVGRDSIAKLSIWAVVAVGSPLGWLDEIPAIG
jgi:hypothetical protein